ncbi:MAG: immunoglobulin domain-containing protein [Verrucomicrobiota bacterium]
MKTNPPPILLTGSQWSSAAAAFLAAAFPLSAQTITNPGFETDHFGTAPGYVSGNPPGITGWTGSPAGNYGQNPANGSPFADNGAIPEGENVAFIQGVLGDTLTELSTEITGLTSGTVYRLSFRVNVRSGGLAVATLPNLSVSVGGLELLAADAAPVGGASPYKYVYLDFTASSTTETLVLHNNQNQADTTILLDDFTITAAPAPDPAWSVEEWLDDSTSGVDPTYRYTHAYSLGTATATTINDIPFKPADGTTPAEAGKFMLTGMGTVYPVDGNNTLSGNSQALTSSFLYGGNPGVLTLQGLTPGKSYVVTFYSTGWEDQGKRPVTFFDGNKRFFADQDAFGNNAGVRIVHTYTASAEGTGVISFQGLGGTLHLCAFSNREATKEATAAPEFSVQPTGRKALPGDTVTFSGGATGLPVPSYQWLHDGVEMPGETAATLQVNVADKDQSGVYTLKAINSTATVSSQGAFLEVMEPVTAGPFFSTGVDSSGSALATGDTDPHYTLIENQGGELNIPAVLTFRPDVWLPNTGFSAWTGPIPDTVASPVGRFTYRTTVDAGANPATFSFSGLWAADNAGSEIRVNDQAVTTGVETSPGYNSYALFNISQLNAPSLKAGANTVDFVTDNLGAVGYTGLRTFAARVPDGVSPALVETPQGKVAGPGDTVTFTARAYGTAPLTYTWSRDGVAIPQVTGPVLTLTGVTSANSGSYTVKATNALSTSASSAAAVLKVLSPVPGFGSTGLAANGAPLDDGSEDTRYVLSQNPDGPADAPAIVHSTTVAPIVNGPWLASSGTSKWISTRADSIAAPGGDYVYKTTLDLTGFDPASAVITGSWSSDNTGKGIRVNGAATGLTITGDFTLLTPFRIDDSNANFISGVNTIEFVVENASLGYTALRVDSLRALAMGSTPAGPVPVVTIQLSGTGKPLISVTGAAGTYPIQRSTTLGTAESPWAAVGEAVVPAGGGSAQFEDTTAPVGRAFYRVVIP